MAGRRLMTLDIRELVRRLRAGEADRAVARDLGVARKTVARYRSVAAAEGWLEGALPPPEEMDRRLAARPTEVDRSRLPCATEPYRAVIEELRREKVEMVAIHQRLRAEHGYTGSYSSLRRFVLRIESKDPEGFIRLEVGPGEEAQVDFGYAGMMADPRTGEVRRAWAFVMTLSHSRHQYAVLVFDQTIGTWLRCHLQAFEYFGGVPAKIVLDNLKAAIVQAVLHDPVVQRSYRECAEHYGFLISPCRPRTPRHKGKVESGVRYLKRNFLAGRSFRDLTEANTRLREWIEQVAGVRIHGTIKERPLARFFEAEQAALLPLPAQGFDLGIWKKVKLHPDCHVVVDGAFYSAPHRLIGQQLWARSNGRDVLLFHEYERIASHPWTRPGTRRTIPDHYPPDKLAWLLASPRWCREKAAAIGEATTELIDRLLGERPLDRLRTAQAILRLADKHGPSRLEAACRRALHFNEVAYGPIKRILAAGLQAEPLPLVVVTNPAPCHRSYTFARSGSEIFA